MPFTFELTDRVVQFRPKGDVEQETNLQGVTEALTAVRAAWRTNGNRPFDILIDLRESLENRSAGELRSLAELMAGHADVLTGRIAIVATDSLRYALGRVFEVFSDHLGQTPRMFSDCAAAEAWFADEA